MRTSRALTALLTTSVVLLALPSAGLAKDVPEIPVTLSPTAKKFKRTSTLKVKFNAPYNLGSQAVAEYYHLEVIPPARSKCRTGEAYSEAPLSVGEAITLDVTAKEIAPEDSQHPRWCEGTYRVLLIFEDPTSSDKTGPPPEGPPDESGPDDEYTADGEGYGIDLYEIARRSIKVR